MMQQTKQHVAAGEGVPHTGEGVPHTYIQPGTWHARAASYVGACLSACPAPAASVLCSRSWGLPPRMMLCARVATRGICQVGTAAQVPCMHAAGISVACRGLIAHAPPVQSMHAHRAKASPCAHLGCCRSLLTRLLSCFPCRLLLALLVQLSALVHPRHHVVIVIARLSESFDRPELRLHDAFLARPA